MHALCQNATPTADQNLELCWDIFFTIFEAFCPGIMSTWYSIAYMFAKLLFSSSTNWNLIIRNLLSIAQNVGNLRVAKWVLNQGWLVYPQSPISVFKHCRAASFMFPNDVTTKLNCHSYQYLHVCMCMCNCACECVCTVLAQALLQVHGMWNDADSENLQRIQQTALLQCVSCRFFLRNSTRSFSAEVV